MTGWAIAIRNGTVHSTVDHWKSLLPVAIKMGAQKCDRVSIAATLETMRTQIVATGSVDGVLTTAAYIRLMGGTPIFTQAFTCQQEVAKIESGSSLVFVDLAVNHQDRGYTKDFVEFCLNKGCTITAIVDEHDAEAWKSVLPPQVWENLTIKPVSQKTGEIKSSGALLLKVAGDRLDQWGKTLCHAADRADAGVFEGVAEIVNKAIKAKIGDSQRRSELATWFSKNQEPNETILGWVAEYDTLQANMQQILETAEFDARGYVYFDSRNIVIDRTSLVKWIYDKYPLAKIVICRGVAFDKERGGSFPCHTFMVSPNADADTDLTKIISAPGWGFAKVFNVEDEHYQSALAQAIASL